MMSYITLSGDEEYVTVSVKAGGKEGRRAGRTGGGRVAKWEVRDERGEKNKVARHYLSTLEWRR